MGYLRGLLGRNGNRLGRCVLLEEIEIGRTHNTGDALPASCDFGASARVLRALNHLSERAADFRDGCAGWTWLAGMLCGVHM